MMILALDTSMAACSAAVIDGDSRRVLASVDETMERGHAEAIAPMVERVLREAGRGPGALNRIAVTTGPGTFTGVRIGLAMARGLGLSLSIPVIGIDSLKAIAASAGDGDGDVPILVACHARNHEAYVALHGPGIATLDGPALVPLAAVAGMAPHGAHILGTAADSVMALPGAEGLIRSRTGDLPSAARFGWLAANLTPADAMPAPLYLRAPDARPQAMASAAETIIPVGPDAAELLAALHAASFDRPWSAPAIAALLATPGSAAALSTRGGEPAGFILTRSAAGEAEILTIAVLPALRRHGIARRLLAQHLQGLASHGVTAVFLEVAASNQAARALYERLGFSAAGLRRGYYALADGSREDAIVMRRALSP